MDKERAKKITKSQKLIPVSYKGREVYINHIDEEKGVARVFPLDNLNSEFSVELTSLDEK